MRTNQRAAALRKRVKLTERIKALLDKEPRSAEDLGDSRKQFRNIRVDQIVDTIYRMDDVVHYMVKFQDALEDIKVSRAKRHIGRGPNARSAVDALRAHRADWRDKKLNN